ncbi:membrane-associated transporter protein isoform X2 [Adelges cooleyi]|uniref:membrane-associated transporter protein isoform X2 n=1 Tax=Adelges cooleyi TaxID=133065 RepID=UPI002180267A|nr:membrane-associated transporter protein isoform X2 [Adelges cooleyi]
MVDKLHEYQGPVGIAHTWRDALQERWYGWKENRPRTLLQLLQSLGLAEVPGSPVEDGQTPAGVDMDQYSHIFRKKTRRELIRISAAVMGIEFSYAAETAFVSPTLLKIGVDHQHMTLVWAVSPCIGFFVTPILGSLSDRCTLPLGRRRPFLILLACGVFLGMMLVPNGESLGHWVEGASGPGVSNFWPIFFTVLGTVLLDFDADACQSPARAYLLDICVPEDHAKGLSTFTVMAGLGGFVGYLLGAVDWDSLKFGELMGGHVRAVFTLVTFLFVGCISYTVSSFKEMPLKLQRYNQTRIMVTDVDQGGDGDKLTDYAPKSYGTLVDALEENNEPVLIPAPPGSQGKLLYEQGVRFGSMGMSMYSLSCACYSSVIEKFIKRFGAKRVYTGGLLFYSAGMFMMAVTRHKFSVIFFSWAAGVMYSTMFTMPFLLIAHYHSTNKFSESLGDNERVDDQIRGLGTDVAVVSSSVFVAQFILSMCMGTIVNFFGTTSAVVYTASFLGFCASLIASQIVYMDL